MTEDLIINSKEHNKNEHIKNTKEEILCKICHSICDEESPYAAPCKCKGSLKYIHKECLNEWLTLCQKTNKAKKCDICHHPFNFKKKFREGAPEGLPFYYILLYFAKRLFNYFVDFLCLVYALAKFSFILLVNSKIASVYLFEVDAPVFVFFSGIAFTFVNIFHTHFLKKALKVIGSLHVRIDTSRVLDNILENSTHASATYNHSVQSVPVTEAAGNGDRSSSNDSDSIVYEDVYDFSNQSISSLLLQRPTFENIKKDVSLILSLCSSSFVYPIIYYLALFCRISILSNSSLVKFIDQIELERFYRESHTFILALLFLSSIFYILKTRTSYHPFKIAFGLLKSYTFLVCLTLYVLVNIGVISHYLFSLIFNNYVPFFMTSDFRFSVFMHLAFGTGLTYMLKSLKKNLTIKFRKGFIVKSLRNEKIRTLVQYSVESSFMSFFKKCIFNFLGSCSLILFFCFITKVCMKLHKDIFNDFFQKKQVFLFDAFLRGFIYLKGLMIFYRNSSDISKFFAASFERIFRFYSRYFDAENYLYNKEVAGSYSKDRLVWDLNCKYASFEYIDYVQKVNRLLQDNLHNSDLSKQGPVSPLNTALNTTYNAEETDFTHQRLVRGLDDEVSDTKSVSTFYGSLQKDKNLDLLERYKITDKRIAKYFGRSHNRKISIFLKPKHFTIFKILCIVSCLLFSQFVFTSSFFMAFCFSRFFKQAELSSSIFFVAFASIFSLFCNSRSLSWNFLSYQRPIRGSRSFLMGTSPILNRLIVILYSNIIFPCSASLALVFFYANMNRFACFTYLFIIFNSLSSFSSAIFENIFIVSPLSTYSIFYVLKQLLSFAMLKLTLYFILVIYKKIIRFNSYSLPIIFIGSAVFQVARIMNFIFSGDLISKIKDSFFLENTDILDYEHSNDS